MHLPSGSRNHEQGFTVGAILMVMSLLGFAGAGTMSFLSRGHHPPKPDPEKEAYQQMLEQGRLVLDRMVQEVELAGTPAPNSTQGDYRITAATSNRVASGRFLVAAPTQLIFEADPDHDGVVERIEYRLNGSELERSAVSKYPDGTAPAARYETVTGNLDNGAMPLFSYLDSPAGPADCAAVRIVLLLRPPAVKPQKAPYQAIAFEGIARRQNAVAARQDQLPEQTQVESESAALGMAANGARIQEMSIQELSAIEWTTQ